MLRNKLFIVLSHIIAASYIGCSINAHAQEQDANTHFALEEVMVTARKKTENLQLVPDTVAVLSGDTVERANITNARDVTARMPNVSIVESLSPTSTFIIVRGISSVRNSESAVAVVVDGVQVGSASEVSQSYYDIEQIELLKGPQGALYGRNALGGALIITSKKPGNEFEGKINIGTGGGGLKEVSGSFSGPLSDELFFRVAGNQKSFDGTIENEYLNRVLERNSHAVTGYTPKNSYMDFEDNEDFRVQLLWEPSDNTSVDYRYSENNLETGAMWYRNIYRLESNPNQTYEFPINSNGNPTAIRGIDSHTLLFKHAFESTEFSWVTNHTDTHERYGVAGEVRGSDRTGNVLFFTEPFVEEFIAQLDNQVDRDFFTAQLGGQLDGNFVGSDQYYDIETLSSEARFSGDTESLSYVGGAYILLTERADTIRATWETPNGAPFNCTPAYPGGPSATDFTCNGLINATQNEQDNTAWALFASADYSVTDTVTLTLAGRYDEDRREVTRIDGPTVDTNGLGVGACDSDANPEICAAANSTLAKTFSAFQPKASLVYAPSDAWSFYSTFARGFRSGGFNASGALLTDSYDKETLDSFEVGFKTTLLDNRLRASSALFYQDYKNAQQFEFDGNTFVQSLYNIPQSEIYGIEATIDLAVTESLTFGAGFGLMDSKIKEFDDEIFNRMESELLARTANSVKLPEGTQEAFDHQFEGEHLPNFAHQTANVFLQHELPVGTKKIITRLDYSHFGDRYWWLDGQDVQKSVNLMDSSISLMVTDNLEFQLWCKNCFDTEYDSEYAPTEKELFGGAAKDVAYQARGITWGVKAKYDF